MIEMEKKFQELINELNIEIVDIEYVKDGGNNYLRVYIESNQGKTTLDDCENVSRKISDEADNFINEKFILEVSTPGIERKLKKEKDFIRFKGQKVDIRTKNNIYDSKKFIGILKDFVDNKVIIDEYEIPIDKIKQAKLVFDFANIKEEEQ